MYPFAFRVSGPRLKGGGEGAGSNLHQNLPWTGGDLLAKSGAWVWISIHPSHTNRHTNICTPIYI